MNYSAPKPFFIEGGRRAVLLLHSFTGSTIDMKKLGKYLVENGYTVHAPMYSGHGEEVEKLLEFGPKDWWEDVLTAYEHLEDEGYEEIAIVGISLGAVLTLKAAQQLAPIGIVTMSVPMDRDEITLRKRVVYYAKNHMQYEEHYTAEEKADRLTKLKADPMEIIPKFRQLITEQLQSIERIETPILTMYGDRDEPLYKESSNYILQRIGSKEKNSTHYAEAGHLMTYGIDASKVNADILFFLEGLPWLSA